MTDLSTLTPEDIKRMSYNELIGVVRETNRPPGGRRSITQIANSCFLRRESRVLEIGCSTGTTAIELARLVGCEITGIDINEISLTEARGRADAHRLKNVKFEKLDATRLPFPDESFDLVFCGNVTSLVDDKDAAFREYRRVTRFGGFIAAIPMYYVETPPQPMVDRVRKAIQVNIPIAYRDDAVRFYMADDFELFDAIDFHFAKLKPEEVQSFCREILARPHLASLPTATRSTLEAIYAEQMELFRENLSHMGFTILLLRKTALKEDQELFVASVVGR
jgi:SAM-dependent methyltransferase